MDDDVKNFFQKFGQTTAAYQEINRDADSEQARQRWPLLRDVRMHAQVDDVEQEEEELAAELVAESTLAPHIQVKPVVREEVSVVAQTERLGLLTQPHSVAGAIQSSAKSSSGNFGLFSSNRFDATNVTQNEKQQVEQSLFNSKAVEKTANLSSIKQTKSHLEKSSESVENEKSQGHLGKVSKLQSDNSLTSVFQRLAKKSEPEPVPETSASSFFKKIFKS